MLIINAVLSFAASYRLLMTFQQSGYKRLNLFHYNLIPFIYGALTLAVSLSAMIIDLITSEALVYYTAGAVVLLSAVIYFYFIVKSKYKKPLVFTNRVIRLISVLAVLIIIYQLLFFTKLRCLVFGINFLVPFFILLADKILSPLEKINNGRYIKKAKDILASSKAVKIGITGSFGKTSVKNILKEILMRKYNVVMTPQSFNTPLGIARTASEIKENTEVFIAEMGARHRGDIKELVNIVRPEIGIVTGVNRQHLETFKSIETTTMTKYELIEGLTGRKLAVVNADNTYTLEMSKKTLCITAGESESADIRVMNIKTDSMGTNFDVKAGDSVFSLTTRLLGRHNAVNIALSVAVALQLNVDIADIKGAVFDLKPVSHRLELISGTRGITIIDDTYNGNPDGAAAALDVLSEFPGRKVVVTPGLVELGKASPEENRKLGERLKTVCDLVILIKSNEIKYIKEGLSGYDFSKIIEYDSLKQATTEFSKTLKDRDTLLLLNDLPDSMGG